MHLAIEGLIELDEVSPKRIAVIGDALTDMWIHGKMLPSQDGCDKFVEEYRRVTEGGASNAVNCLSDWKANVHFFGNEVRGRKTRYLVNGKIVFRHDREIILKPCMPSIVLESYDAILLSDYDKGYLSTELIQHLIRRANELHIPIVADCKRHPDLYRGAILKGNFYYNEHFGPVDVVTRGSASPIVNGNSLSELPPVKCANHVGAGDCFAAHLTLALAYGFSLEDAASIAHKASWVYVQYPHNRYPRKKEMLDV